MNKILKPWRQDKTTITFSRFIRVNMDMTVVAYAYSNNDAHYYGSCYFDNCYHGVEGRSIKEIQSKIDNILRKNEFTLVNKNDLLTLI